MKKSALLAMLTVCVVTLSSCGMYVGSPPKTEVDKTTTNEMVPAPDRVHVITTSP